MTAKKAKGPRCLVCGHYHGGHGSCVTSHVFVLPADCPTCVEEERRRTLLAAEQPRKV